MSSGTQGDRIRALFQSAEDEVVIIAPFIKVGALQSLMDVIPTEVRIRCVTRWLPQEVAAGVSDPEILDTLEERGSFSLTLVDRLHAKLYVAGGQCLVGSANVTLAGLGGNFDSQNIEVLVETTVDDPGVVVTLNEIAEAERPATRAIAEAARRLADSLPAQMAAFIDADLPWFPRSRRPEHAYRLYASPPTGYLGAADRTLVSDIATSNLQPGLSETAFRAEIRSLLAGIPIAANLLQATEDTTLTRAEVNADLERITGDAYSTNDLWLAFANWMAFFFSDKVMKQEMAEIALRRAQVLG